MASSATESPRLGYEFVDIGFYSIRGHAGHTKSEEQGAIDVTVAAPNGAWASHVESSWDRTRLTEPG